MIPGMHTHQGGRIVVAGEVITLLPGHELARHVNQAANAHRFEPSPALVQHIRWASGLSAVLSLLVALATAAINHH